MDFYANAAPDPSGFGEGQIFLGRAAITTDGSGNVLLNLRNDLGLLAEEYDPRAKRQLGNFPQAFTHVALVNTARMLGEKKRRAAKDN